MVLVFGLLLGPRYRWLVSAAFVNFSLPQKGAFFVSQKLPQSNRMPDSYQAGRYLSAANLNVRFVRIAVVHMVIWCRSAANGRFEPKADVLGHHKSLQQACCCQIEVAAKCPRKGAPGSRQPRHQSFDGRAWALRARQLRLQLRQ